MLVHSQLMEKMGGGDGKVGKKRKDQNTASPSEEKSVKELVASRRCACLFEGIATSALSHSWLEL